MRSFVIAAVMTGLVAGLGFAWVPASPPLAPAARKPIAAPSGGPPRALAPADAAAGDAPAASSEPAAALTGERTFYQWTDERGAVRFARSLEEVPSAWRSRAGKVEVDMATFQAKPATRQGPSAPRATPTSDAGDPRRPRFHDVTVYTAPWCGWCRKTLAFLDARKVDYVNKDIEANEDWAQELEEKSGGHAVPFVEIDGSQLRGYRPNEMAALLE
jgi:glutaredoxin